jgi:hypothetical protein
MREGCPCGRRRLFDHGCRSLLVASFFRRLEQLEFLFQAIEFGLNGVRQFDVVSFLVFILVLPCQLANLDLDVGGRLLLNDAGVPLGYAFFLILLDFLFARLAVIIVHTASHGVASVVAFGVG